MVTKPGQETEWIGLIIFSSAQIYKMFAAREPDHIVIDDAVKELK